jgi:hypothetical protein
MDSQRGPPASKKVYAVFGRDMAGQSCSFKDKKDKECVQGEQPQVRGGAVLQRPDAVPATAAAVSACSPALHCLGPVPAAAGPCICYIFWVQPARAEQHVDVVTQHIVAVVRLYLPADAVLSATCSTPGSSKPSARTSHAIRLYTGSGGRQEQT